MLKITADRRLKWEPARLGKSVRGAFGKVSLPRSLGSRLVLGNILVLVLTLTIMGVIVHQLVTHRLLTEMDGRLRMRAAELETVTRIWKATGQPLDPAFFNRLVQGDALDEVADPIHLKLVDRQTGLALIRSSDFQRERVVLQRPDFETASSGRQLFSTQEDDSGSQVRVLIFPLRDATQQVVLVGQLHQSLQSVERVGVILLIVLVLGGLFAVILAYGAGLWLTRRQLHPLNELASTMHDLSDQGLHVRLHPHKPTAEIELLTEAFNQMLGRLEASFTLQRAFVADVSHELRTPLTAIRGQLDVMLFNPDLQGELRQDVQQVNAELARLSRLVVNLLTNARAEAGMSPQLYQRNIQPVELDMLLIEVARQMRFLSQHVKLEISQLEQIRVPGDSDLLKQLLFNLVDNAVTYTQPGGQVCLGLSKSEQDEAGDYVVLYITDSGPGIAPTELPHIFERHYRAPQASSRSKAGAGLGLYIARLIAQAHGGEIKVQSELSKGTSFMIRLPVTSETVQI